MSNLGGDVPSGAPREVPVDWEALEDAFENNAPEVHSYLHIGTGEVLRVVDGIADPEMHARIAVDANYTRIDPVSSREQYRWMERFIQMLDDEELVLSLTQAIDGKGAFRRFKDVLMSRAEERERWFAFRSERLRVFMEAWLAAHALAPVPRQVWPVEPEASPPSEGSASAPDPRRVRSTDSLRRQIRDVIDILGTRELDKVLAFAEFVKSRRPPRSHAPRADEARPEASSDASSTSDDVEPPSSGRRSAAK
jgi:hypothetical protein